MKNVPISICTAVWNGLDFTKAFVDSVKKNSSLEPYELVIVDNGSDPEVSDFCRQEASKYFRFETNQGFCKGFNKALELAGCEYVLLTNNDTLWAQENWKKILFHEFLSHKKCGLLFPVANNIFCPANLRISKGSKTFKLNKWERFLCSGVAIFSKKEIFLELGGFDESYGTSGEDLDLQCKAWEEGYEIYVTEKVFVDHIGKGTSQKLGDWKELWRVNHEKFNTRWNAKLRPRKTKEGMLDKIKLFMEEL